MVLSQDHLFPIKEPTSQHVKMMEKSLQISKTLEPSPMYTLNDLLIERVRLDANSPLFAYPGSAKGADDYIHYNAKDLDRFADEAVKRYMSLGVLPKVGSHRLNSQTLLNTVYRKIMGSMR